MIESRPLIAVVDDEESFRRALTRLLEASRFKVAVFASGQEFLDSLSNQRPDCVILDFQMPGLTGRDVQRHLINSHTALPIIIVTAHDHPALREQCIADGAVAYFTKPLPRTHLLSTVEEALKKPAQS